MLSSKHASNRNILNKSSSYINSARLYCVKRKKYGARIFKKWAKRIKSLCYKFIRAQLERDVAQGKPAQARFIALRLISYTLICRFTIHEVGHHVQTMLGTLGKVHNLQQQVGKTESNALSVKLELQADCYAGVWGYYAQKDGLFEDGDIEEAYVAAEAVGDDTLQQRAQGYTVPHTYTHGTSAERKKWLQRGLQTGDINQCNTFGAQ